MPESVKDRPTRAHEYVFMLTKSDKYRYHADQAREMGENGITRNRRSVWNINTAASAGAHIASFPPALVEPCLLAATQPGDMVLDPFFGCGTVGLVAKKLGRRYLGIELNPEYVAAAMTLLEPASLDLKKAREKSPTTNRFYSLPGLAEGEGDEFEDFRNRIASLAGIRNS